MTKEELTRIKQAYYSGLKVQIWFDGYWENFDARDYSMYSDPFSENRQYRIIGSDYADIAEKHIAELEKENAELKTVKIPQLERKIASIRGAHSVDCKKLNARLEQCERQKERIADLEKANEMQALRIKECNELLLELKVQIKKMKCCGNCNHFNYSEPNYCHKGVYRERQYVCSEWEFGD